MGLIQAVKTDITTAVYSYKGLGTTAAFFSFFQGRTTTFAIALTVVGIIGFFKQYDMTGYALFAGSILGGVAGHSLKEDYFEMRHRQLDQQTSVSSTKTESTVSVPPTTADKVADPIVEDSLS
jgi:hypothetical protein